MKTLERWRDGETEIINWDIYAVYFFIFFHFDFSIF